MVDHDLLHKELANLATAAGSGNFDLHDGLYQLSVTAAAALGVDGAGLTVQMPTGLTEYITATDAITLSVERRQDELKEGACVDAINTSQVVAVNDLAAEAHRWPAYAPFVLDAGFNSIAGVPLPFQGRNIGALNLYGNTTRAWTTEEFAAGRVIAGLAGAYLINTHLLGEVQTLATQLQQALDSRILIEQAKGVMAGRHGMTPDAAFGVLRSYARSNRVKIHEVAQQVVTGQADLVDGNPGSGSEA